MDHRDVGVFLAMRVVTGRSCEKPIESVIQSVNGTAGA